MIYNGIYSSKTDMPTYLLMHICIIVLESKSIGKYSSVFQIIYKQERNDKRAFYNDRKLE